MKLITKNIDENQKIPSINNILKINKSIPIIFFVDIDNTLLLTLSINNINNNFNTSAYNIINTTPRLVFEPIIINKFINNIEIINITKNEENIYTILIVNNFKLFKIIIKFREDIDKFFQILKDITQYVGLFTAGNEDYAYMIYKIIMVIYGINLSFCFSVSNICPEYYQISLNNDLNIYNGKDLDKAIKNLQKVLINNKKPIYTIPILIDDNPIWCLNGWILPISKLTINENKNFDEIYDKDIYYTNVEFKKN